MKRSAKILTIFVAVMMVAVGVILAIANTRKSTERIAIVTTNFPAYDFARAVAGEKADIKMLVKPGAEIHDFDPTPQDIIDIKNSDMVIYTGGESDEWIRDVLDDIDADESKVLKMMDAVEVAKEETVEGMENEDSANSELRKDEDGALHEHDEENEEYDEHVWTSLKNAKKIVGVVKDKLLEISPENKDFFENNAAAYTDELEDIDLEFWRIVEGGRRKTIVFGDRFPLRYFVDDYGLEYFAAFPGCSEQTEASSQTIAFLVDKVKQENIPVVFRTEMSNGKIVETIANETGAKVLVFDSAHNITAEDFASDVTYAEKMRKNIEVLEEALK